MNQRPNSQWHGTRLWPEAASGVSLFVVTISTVLFLAVSVLHCLHLVGWQQAFSWLGLSRSAVADHLCFHQFVTAPLLHGSLTHLAFNMLSLWMLGPGVEQALGRKRYAIFSLVCAWASLAGFLLLSRSRFQIGMGYSGVIFGILAAQAMLFPDNRLVIFAFFPLRMRYAAVVLGVIELYLTLSSGQGAPANASHLVGGLAGFACLNFFRRKDQRTRTPGGGYRPPRPAAVSRRVTDEIPHEL
jgi:membrane associated rhomboid family serine protease